MSLLSIDLQQIANQCGMPHLASHLLNLVLSLLLFSFWYNLGESQKQFQKHRCLLILFKFKEGTLFSSYPKNSLLLCKLSRSMPYIFSVQYMFSFSDKTFNRSFLKMNFDEFTEFGESWQNPKWYCYQEHYLSDSRYIPSNTNRRYIFFTMSRWVSITTDHAKQIPTVVWQCMPLTQEQVYSEKLRRDQMGLVACCPQYRP